jgi:hypothetical protein
LLFLVFVFLILVKQDEKRRLIETCLSFKR